MFSCSHCSESSKVNELQLEFDDNDRNGSIFFLHKKMEAGVPVH